MDTANSISFFLSDLDVSLVSPSGSPGVSDQVVWDSVFFSVSNSSDSVVQRGSTGSSSDDTRSVVVEDTLVSFDGDRNWSLSNGSLEFGDDVALNVVDLLDLGGVVILGPASVSDGLVWVVLLEVKSVPHSQLHAVFLPSSVTSVGLSVAVNAHLLGQLNEFSSLDEVSSFNLSSGREGPAGSALGLVLNWVHSSLFNPVDGIWNGNIRGVKEVWVSNFLDALWSSVTSVFSLLFLSHIREEVMSNLVSVGWILVMRGNEVISLNEQVSSHDILVVGAIGLTVNQDVVVEEVS